MHAKGVAHRDVKPHNVLLQQASELPAYCRQVRANLAHLVSDTGTAFREGSGEGGGGTIFGEDEKLKGVTCDWHAVLMDFGSAGSAVV